MLRANSDGPALKTTPTKKKNNNKHDVQWMPVYRGNRDGVNAN